MVVRQVAVHARACGVVAGRNGGQRGGRGAAKRERDKFMMTRYIVFAQCGIYGSVCFIFWTRRLISYSAGGLYMTLFVCGCIIK